LPFPPAQPSTSALNLAFKEDASYRHVLRNGHLRDWTRCQWIPIGTGNEDGRSTDSGFKSGCASVDVISNFIPEHTQAHEEAADLAHDLPAGNAPLCTAVNAGRCDASAVASPDADGDGIDPSTDLSHSARTVIVTPSLLLGDYLGHGRLYTTYRGQISFDGDTTQKPCVVKLVDFDSFSVSHSVGSTEYGSEEARQAVRNELDILAGPLRNYQGVWVPEVYGAWEVRPGDSVGEWTVKTEGACVVVMEDAGQSIWDGRGELTESERSVSLVTPAFHTLLPPLS